MQLIYVGKRKQFQAYKGIFELFSSKLLLQITVLKATTQQILKLCVTA